MVTIFTYFLLFVINFVIGEDWFIKSSLIATLEFGLLWICILVCSFTKLNKLFKIGISLILSSISTILSNLVCSKVLNIHDIYNNLVGVMFIVIGIVLFISEFISKAEKKKLLSK